MQRIIVTGAAGFIGFHLARRFLADGFRVLGIDSVTDYYDPALKEDRLRILLADDRFAFERMALEEGERLQKVGREFRPDAIVNLAAQAGVRYSIDHPSLYIQSNVVGFHNVLELARRLEVRHLVYASSSSVYGANTSYPFSVHDNVDHPVSLYAATKKANELMAHTYSHLFRIPTTGLRFFTVYGPWGRPDMAYFKFTKAILSGKPISVYNNGRMRRDFTYVDDIVEGTVRVVARPAESNPNWNSDAPDPGTSEAPYRIYNIGNSRPVELLEMIEILEDCLGRKAEKVMMEMQAGEVPATAADVSDLERDVGFQPSTPLETGLRRFVDWYRGYYRV
ncbi:MAG: NAD-dependent epimerase [Fimbriimonadaceae bacterium]